MLAAAAARDFIWLVSKSLPPLTRIYIYVHTCFKLIKERLNELVVAGLVSGQCHLCS